MNGNIARMKDGWQALYDAGAELVLSGHDHVYERFAPQDAEGRRDDARDSNHFGVLKLVLGEDGYDWEFLEAPDDAPQAGRRRDRCH